MNHLQNLLNKITSPQEAVEQLKPLKAAGKKVAFTNGCFDILHKGHVEYLAQSASRGDVLIVGINSDASVKRQGKGNDRPINQFSARATVLAALGFIDFVVEFDDDTPIKLIETIQPDVLLKGADYDPQVADSNDKRYIVGREIVLENGGSVEVIDLVEGYSTTNLINQMKK
ncbi:MAG: D-glycero-beta-D-manno-heptose 1-phosphate adenylyltransferase [Flavobacteriales bacterium]|jgi:rfaE bifunctional protein nucleotidyltransferase chain/domain|nr:D-glycero-beta-D-manno-heptose 1-phosphate adenylyltransferase [Flavobacteriales bacterium]